MPAGGAGLVQHEPDIDAVWSPLRKDLLGVPRGLIVDHRVLVFGRVSTEPGGLRELLDEYVTWSGAHSAR